MSGNTIRVALLGKTGCGKSSLCNTLFGEDLFQTEDSANSGTDKCEAKTRDVDGRSFTLIDTPGFFDTKVPEEQQGGEVVRCVTECAPGPHAFLVLLKVERFTPQEKQIIEKIQQSFSEEAFKYVIIIFTHGDQLRKGMKINAFVQQSEGLRDLVSRCGGRCHVFDSRYWNQQDEYRSNQFQMGELFNTIDKMMKEQHGGCYTNIALQQVERMIQEEEQRIKQNSKDKTHEEIKEQMVTEWHGRTDDILQVETKIQEEEEHDKETTQAFQMSSEEIREQAKENVCQTLKMSNISTIVMLGAFLGSPLMIMNAMDFLANAGSAGRVQDTAIKAAGAAVGASAGAVKATAGAVVRGSGRAAAGVKAAVAAGVAVVRAGIGYKETEEKTTTEEEAKHS